MGFLDKLFGKPPAKPVETEEEKQAKVAKAIDNALWATEDELSRFVPWVAGQYAKGQVKGFDNTNVEAQRPAVEEAVDKMIIPYRSMLRADPAAEARFDEIRNGGVQRILDLLRIVPSTPAA